MRLKERIPIFLKYVNFDFLQERWNTDISQYVRGLILQKVVKEYWLSNPDLRFGQMLINLEYLPDNLIIWNDEERDILDAQGIPKREIMLWGNNYDKDMNQLPKTIWRPIAEMSTKYIQAILDGSWAKNPEYKKVFEEEIQLRQ
jgi:hypothetical protein